MIGGLSRQIEKCARKEKMRVQTAEKEWVFHHIDTSFFSILQMRVCQTVLRKYEDQVFWYEDSLEFLRPFLGFLQIHFGKKAMNLKVSAFGAYPVKVLLLIFSKDCKTWLIQSGYSLVLFLLVETENIAGTVDTDIDVPRGSLCGHFTFVLLVAKNPIQRT